MRVLLRDQCGVAYVEFLIAFMPLFVLVLGLTQLALLGQAHLAVRHAANAAVRSAVVVIDDDPARYGGTPRRSLDPINGSAGGSSGFLASIGAASVPRRGDARSRDIRMAAYVPLLAIAPGRQQLVSSDGRRTIQRAVGTNELGRAAFGLLYVLGSTGVVFGEGRGPVQYAEGDDVRVRVTHAYPCLVPLASRLLCDSYLELRTGAPITSGRALIDRIRQGHSSVEDLRAILAAERRVQDQRARLQRARGPLEDLEQAELAGLLWATVATGTRFRMLTAEASLPLQSAPYPYQSEVSR
ncbi:MAG: pilus assembly protein [Myxococcota bacterium]|nr:pilus assembly protein [Myxococcota bacterium]